MSEVQKVVKGAKKDLLLALCHVKIRHTMKLAGNWFKNHKEETGCGETATLLLWHLS